MALDLDHPTNRDVLRYIKRLGAKEFVGVHPDILDRMIALCAKVPRCVRRSIRGVRIIAHRKTGVIIAVAFGTSYCLRVGAALKEAKRAKLRPSENFLDGGLLNVSRRFGSDWLFGCWHKKEVEWLTGVVGDLENDL